MRAMAWTTTRRSESMAALSVKSRAMTAKTIRGGSAAAASRGSRSSRPRCAAACREAATACRGKHDGGGSRRTSAV